MLPTNIKNIILDLGGVIINLDTQKPFNSFKKLFADNYSEIETTFTTLNLFNNFEVGKVTAEEFILFFLLFGTACCLIFLKKELCLLEN